VSAVDAEIEHALRAAWSLDALAAYADHLQLRGDPRGELIAFDLHPLADHHAWRKRRRALLAAWLGELADRAGHLVQHGFIHSPSPRARALPLPHHPRPRRSRAGSARATSCATAASRATSSTARSAP
jgi:hypothetical protein